MIEAVKKEKESSANLLRRFNKRKQQSGVLFSARKNRFKVRPESKFKKKMNALKRVKKEKKTEYLKKLGKIK